MEGGAEDRNGQFQGFLGKAFQAQPFEDTLKHAEVIQSKVIWLLVNSVVSDSELLVTSCYTSAIQLYRVLPGGDGVPGGIQ